MIAAVLLYGSRARGDSRPDSDTDLLGISIDNARHEVSHLHNLSLHVYENRWLLREASKGGLFLLHIAQEAVALYDPSYLLQTISLNFRFRSDYGQDLETGLQVLRLVMDLSSDQFDKFVTSRYFWAMRTAIAAVAAEEKTAKFGARDQQEFSSIDGLASHINGRETAPPDECKHFARSVLAFVDQRPREYRLSEKKATIVDLSAISALKQRVGSELHQMRYIEP